MGYKISRIAEMPEAEIIKKELQAKISEQHESVINQLIECGVDFDEERFDSIVHRAILHIGLQKCIVSVLFPFLERIGLLWLTKHVVPAQEHFVSYLIQKKILLAIDGIETRPNPQARRILLFTPEGEYHELPLLLMHYLLKKNGAHTVYFGKNISLEELNEYCARQKVSHLYLHFITYFSEGNISEYLQLLTTNFPEQQIVLSGRATGYLESLPANARVLSSPLEMLDFAEIP